MSKQPIRVIVDSREVIPYRFLEAKDITTEVFGLKTGDYALADFPGQTAIERKMLSDFISSITHARERFWRELERMQALPHKCVVIEGGALDVELHNYVSRATPKSVMASALAIQCDFDIPVVWAGSRWLAEWSAAWILRRWHERLTRETQSAA